MTTNRPASVLVIAILNIILGSLGFLCSLCVGGTTLMAPQLGKMAKDAQEKAGAPAKASNNMATDPMAQFRLMEKELPNYFIIEGASYIGFTLLSAVLLAGGIGLVGMRGWARTLTILIAFLSILAQAIHLGWTMMAVLPAQRKVQAVMFDQMKAQLGPQAAPITDIANKAQAFNWILPALITGVVIIYFIVVIAILLSGGVRAAFAGGSPPSSGSEDYYDPQVESGS
jgi:hypothetical protein